MASKLRFDVSHEFLQQFEDTEKLKMLNDCIANRGKSWNTSTEWYKEYILKFYYDDNFTSVYAKYIQTRDKYLKPSIDQIIPKSKGWDCSLNNIRFVTWFENRCKNDMDLDTWERIKANIHEYFI